VQDQVNKGDRTGRSAGASLAFWLLATLGLGLFALGVLATPYCQRLEVRRKLAVEEARLRLARRLVDELQIVCDALAEDPKYVARQIRRDLGYRRPGERPLGSLEAGRPPAPEAVAPAMPPETSLDDTCRVFSRPPVRQAAIACGLMLMVAAFVWFDVPTWRRCRTSEP
jgi:hypothetical protein